MSHGFSADNLRNEIQSILGDARARLTDFAGQTFEGESDEGRIRATVSSAGVVTNVSIHILAKRRHDNLTLSDLILEAINNARRDAAAAKKRVMSDSKVFGMSLQSFIDDPQSIRHRLNIGMRNE